jgi:hypothetical protein
MATGTYGTIRPADVSPTDVDIILNYTQSRDVTNDFQLTKLNSSAVSLERTKINFGTNTILFVIT